ncbi:hypothetical protein THAOC_07075 [Thalassiosira oceanica]|uniref:Uncharacterized protein n=1 Tax=Thalassiosira oceanica TaxID=159749 RepID=K0TDA5_THAOC|nr:hypothetical protein THAOC_07075 [Thalassiosira oceanica]|eukprot:EJK71481.1 hypothetical protein THAOC_07075 [Thalassiosira oceanica]
MLMHGKLNLLGRSPSSALSDIALLRARWGDSPVYVHAASAYFVPCVDSTDGDGLWSNWSDLRQGQSASGRVWAVRGKRNALKGEKRERKERKEKEEEKEERGTSQSKGGN